MKDLTPRVESFSHSDEDDGNRGREKLPSFLRPGSFPAPLRSGRPEVHAHVVILCAEGVKLRSAVDAPEGAVRVGVCSVFT